MTVSQIKDMSDSSDDLEDYGDEMESSLSLNTSNYVARKPELDFIRNQAPSDHKSIGNESGGSDPAKPRQISPLAARM